MKLQLGNILKKFWKDESAQGATEYILLLVAVVAIVVLFKGQIKTQVDSMMQALSGLIGQATSASSGG